MEARDEGLFGAYLASQQPQLVWEALIPPEEAQEGQAQAESDEVC